MKNTARATFFVHFHSMRWTFPYRLPKKEAPKHEALSDLMLGEWRRAYDFLEG